MKNKNRGDKQVFQVNCQVVLAIILIISEK